MKTKPVAVRSRATITPATQNRNKIIIISAISVILILGLILFLVNKQMVGKAIQGQDYNTDLLSEVGSAGIPIMSTATAGLNEQNDLVVGANIGAGDSLLFSFTFTYDPTLITFNEFKSGYTYGGDQGVPIPEAVVDFSSVPEGALTKVTVTGALLPSKTLKEYAIKDSKGNPTSIVPLVVLDITTLNKEETVTIDFTYFNVPNDMGVNLVTPGYVQDTTFKIAAVVPQCPADSCTVGEIHCTTPSTGLYTPCVAGENGCGVWGSSSGCTMNQICKDGACVDPEEQCTPTCPNADGSTTSCFGPGCYCGDNGCGRECGVCSNNLKCGDLTKTCVPKTEGETSDYCSDGLDNDENGLTDCADPTCAYICSPSIIACVDLDNSYPGGKESGSTFDESSLLKREEVKVSYSNGWDYKYIEDSCVDGQKVNETICLSDRGYSSEIYVCPAGSYCQNGACVAPTICTDSDGGLNLTVKGTAQGIQYVSKEFITLNDSCGSDGRIHEQYCKPDNFEYYTITNCPTGTSCKEGACVQNEQTDADGDGIIDSLDRCPAVGESGKVSIEGETIGCWYGDRGLDDCVDMPDIMSYIGNFNRGQVEMPKLMLGIYAWKSAKGCLQ
ncbi:MAG: hypothetical protein AABX04_02085 [Nanoarchaeota archaeon]